jgi:hypothetical protein
MEILSGKVVNGHVDFGDVELPEGATVQAFVLDEEEDEMSAEQLAELEAALEEADRGDVISADEMLRQMRELRERLNR